MERRLFTVRKPKSRMLERGCCCALNISCFGLNTITFKYIGIRWAQVSSLDMTWAFILLSPDVAAVWRCYGCRWRFAVVGLLIGFVTVATGLLLSFCLASLSPPARHRCRFAVASYSEAACFFLGRTSMASTTTMAEAIASAAPSATCSAGMPTSTPVQ